MARNDTLLKKAAQQVEGLGLASPAPLLVGVSGGPDSVCLLHLLWRLAPRLGLSLRVAHLNHGLRGQEADEDARYVAGLAQALGLPLHLGQADVAAVAKARRLSVEAAGRQARYGFFAATAAAVGAQGVAVGHTADDQAETFLLHLLRGAGLTGLRAMERRSWWRAAGQPPLLVLRPLLGVGREETLAYCAAQALQPRQDHSNLSLGPLRNRIRRQLLPLMAQYNPRIREALGRAASALAQEVAYLEEQVDAIWPGLAQPQGAGVLLDTQALGQLPPALQRQVWRRAWMSLEAEPELEAAHLEALARALARPGRRHLSLPGRRAFLKDEGHGWLGPVEAAPYPLPTLAGEWPLAVPGETLIPGWRVEVELLPSTPEGFGKRRSAPGWDWGLGPTAPLMAHMDWRSCGGGLMARGRRPGDRFQPLGLAHPKKLQDFFVDAKVPHPWRDRIPIVAAGERILWVAGLRLDESARVTSSSREVLRLTFHLDSRGRGL
ncbi:MAG: tRNA lysidine(34) synthetase TilS [Chloroflexi bacterium]|nr:tRNA lysidine(34) synthetase TilS [Chloroflexota bacterium]